MTCLATVTPLIFDHNVGSYPHILLCSYLYNDQIINRFWFLIPISNVIVVFGFVFKWWIEIFLLLWNVLIPFCSLDVFMFHHFTHQGHARSSQLVRPGLTLSTMKSNVWAADKFSNTHMACLSLAVWCSKSIKPTNHFSTVFITKFFHNRIPCICVAKNILRAWVADYFPPHHMLFLSTVS